jgi:hypothetical protein
MFIMVAQTVWAQEASIETMEEQPAVIQDVEGLRLQIVQHTQDPQSKEVRLDVVVYSQITSDRVQVVWSVSGVSRLLTSDVMSLSVEPDKSYVVSAFIVPQGFGTTQVLARVQAFQADGTYISTATKTIGSLATQEVVPVTTQYRVAQIVLFIRTFALVVLLLILVVILAIAGFIRFKKILDRND